MTRVYHSYTNLNAFFVSSRQFGFKIINCFPSFHRRWNMRIYLSLFIPTFLRSIRLSHFEFQISFSFSNGICLFFSAIEIKRQTLSNPRYEICWNLDIFTFYININLTVIFLSIYSRRLFDRLYHLFAVGYL